MSCSSKTNNKHCYTQKIRLMAKIGQATGLEKLGTWFDDNAEVVITAHFDPQSIADGERLAKAYDMWPLNWDHLPLLEGDHSPVKM